MNKFFVLGSINVDYVMEVNRLPLLGETLNSQSFLINHGGKGANQAFSLAKQNEEVYLISAVGDDAMGKDAIENLKAHKVHTDFIQAINNTNTGLAFILIENHNNRIILNSGANQKIIKTQILDALKNANENDYLIVQLETNLDAVYFAIQEAKKRKMIVAFNPAPVQEIEKNIFNFIDFLIVNEIECKMLLNCEYNQKEEIQVFLNKYSINYLIITLGDQGALVYTKNNVKKYPAHNVNAIDTTAAGDSFIGAFLSEWNKTNNLDKSMEYAIIASALTCTSIGAQKSIKNRDEIENYLKKYKF